MKFLTETHLQEFSSDKFKYKELSKKILEEILLKMELPNCFGLYGHWGSGKSTLIRFIIQHINSEYDDVLPVYFEPWKYEYSNHNELLFALLHKIRKDLSMKSSAKWKKLFAGLLAIGTGSLKAANVVDMDIQKISSDAKELEEKFCNQHERWVNEVEEFRDSFQSIINDGLKKKRSDKIIIF
ncbi:MAG: hypothetical protein HOH01_01895, partial [Candidatus Jacksonbacteria bacterium]|nr:hypothetical protein [Candidatus Jacksonbacteria bacterium]